MNGIQAFLSIVKPIRLTLLGLAGMVTLVVVKLINGMWIWLGTVSFSPGELKVWTVAGVVAIAGPLLTLLGVVAGGYISSMVKLADDGESAPESTVPASSHDKLIDKVQPDGIILEAAEDK